MEFSPTNVFNTFGTTLSHASQFSRDQINKKVEELHDRAFEIFEASLPTVRNFFTNLGKVTANVTVISINSVGYSINNAGYVATKFVAGVSYVGAGGAKLAAKAAVPVLGVVGEGVSIVSQASFQVARDRTLNFAKFATGATNLEKAQKILLKSEKFVLETNNPLVATSVPTVATSITAVDTSDTNDTNVQVEGASNTSVPAAATSNPNEMVLRLKKISLYTRISEATKEVGIFTGKMTSCGLLATGTAVKTAQFVGLMKVAPTGFSLLNAAKMTAETTASVLTIAKNQVFDHPHATLMMASAAASVYLAKQGYQDFANISTDAPVDIKKQIQIAEAGDSVVTISNIKTNVSMEVTREGGKSNIIKIPRRPRTAIEKFVLIGKGTGKGLAALAVLGGGVYNFISSSKPNYSGEKPSTNV